MVVFGVEPFVTTMPAGNGAGLVLAAHGPRVSPADYETTRLRILPGT
jgi:hypothetical protein